MAKRRHNKSAAIRAMLAQRPDATVNEIVEALACQRIRVTPTYVYNVKAAGSKPKAKSSAYATLIQAKRLADAMGGVDKARAALADLAKLL